MKGGNVCVDILFVFGLESPSLEGYTVRCWVAKQQSGWDFQDQCSVIPLKAVLEGFVIDVEVMCFSFGCESHIQSAVAALTSGE